MMRAGLVVAALVLGGPAQGQAIPLPFSDDVETRQISVVVTPGRRSMRGLPASLVRARRQMHAKQEVSDGNLRRLADYGDGLAAQLYVRRLIARGEAQSRASDLAYYSAIAVGTGRIWTLPEMIEAMMRLDPKTEPRERIRKYISVLYAHAWAGNTWALDAVVVFNGDDKLFGALSQATRDRILAQGQKNGDGRVELRMAMALLEQQELSQAQKSQARDLLERASGSTHLGVMSASQNLIRLMEQNDDATE